MMELYVFRGTAGKAEMITDDKSGKKLPPHRSENGSFQEP
jgi:hypothetical protein